MDGLPYRTKSCEYSSQIEGKMHGCGHDAHMAILMGTAKILNSIKSTLKGNVKLLFEPAEETLGGASYMIKEGVLEDPKVDAVVGLHVSETIECGKIGIKKGVVNAASNPFQIKIIGKGGHGAHPNTAVDPVVIASNVIIALQSIVSREISPTDPAVITVGSIHGGSAPNIIPEEVKITGIIRSLKIEHREYLIKRVTEVVEGIVKAMRAAVKLILKRAILVFIMIILWWKCKRICYNIIGEDNIMRFRTKYGSGSLLTSLGKPSILFLGSGNRKRYYPSST